MKFQYVTKWKLKLDKKEKWHEGTHEAYHFIAPGKTFEVDKWTDTICIKPYAIIFSVYPLIRFSIADITNAITYAAEQGMTEETAELIRAAKALGMTKEPEQMRL